MEQLETDKAALASDRDKFLAGCSDTGVLVALKEQLEGRIRELESSIEKLQLENKQVGIVTIISRRNSLSFMCDICN